MTTVPRLLEKVKKRVYANIEKEPASKQKIFHWAIKTGISYQRKKHEGKNPFFQKGAYNLADKLVFSKIREKLGGRMNILASGGAALAEDVAEFFLAIGLNIIQGYGLTESAPVVSATRLDDNELGTIGKPLFNVEVKLAEDGEILARGPNIMKGYWNDPAATRQAIDEEGWLYTGDIGIYTEKGNIKITDRKKHIFVSSGGKNIAPQPIENLLAQSKYIEHVMLIGDNREFCSALITPDFDQLKTLADEMNIKYDSVTELISNEIIIKHIKNDIDYYQKDLAKFERVRRFSLLSQPFTVENGELSPKMSIKRHIVEKKYAEFIEAMYGEG
jgi:long-chain acyl-CoA synthetase